MLNFVAALALLVNLVSCDVQENRAFNCTGIDAISSRCSSPEAAFKRDYFYVGGQYQFDASRNSSIMVGQIYVDKLTPKGGVTKTRPIILISAGLPSGVGWLNTPDNRQGWASFLLIKRYQIYIIDLAGMGRSSQNDVAIWPTTSASSTDFYIANAFTAPELLNAYPQSQLHTQWPGNGTRGDPIFDAFTASLIPIAANSTIQELTMWRDGCALLRLIGPSYTISHSGGVTWPIHFSDECPEFMLGNIKLEAGNIPFQSPYGNATVPVIGRIASRPWGLTNTRTNYSPPISSPSELSTVIVGTDTPALRYCIMQTEPARQLPNIAKVPYLLLTGEASVHMTYDHCVINYLEQAGVRTKWIKLGEIGIHGNGHFSYMEKNNLEIAEVLELWISNRTKSIDH